MFQTFGAANKIELIWPSQKDTVIVKTVANQLNQSQLIKYFEENKQEDLLYFKAVYTTEGFNLNDDVFDRNELWAARRTPLLKPVNVDHVTSSIVGVIYAVEASTLDGTYISIENDITPDAPYELSIYGVIYSYNFNDVATIAELKSDTNKLFVSMEAWFKDFDYAIAPKTAPLLSYSIIERNSETIKFDKELRCFGGNGSVNDNKIGRLLRNITFGGVGLVDNPANPRSKGQVQKEDKMSDSNLNPDTIAKVEHDKAIAELQTSVDSLKSTHAAELAKVIAESKENSERLAKIEEKAKQASSIADAVLEIDKKYSIEDVKEEDLVKRLEAKFDILTKRINEQNEQLKASIEKIVLLEGHKTVLENQKNDLEKIKAEFDALTKKLETEKALAERKERDSVRIKEVATLGLFDEEAIKTIMANFLELQDSEYNKWLEEKKLIAKMHVKPENVKKISVAAILNAKPENDLTVGEVITDPPAKEAGWSALASKTK